MIGVSSSSRSFAALGKYLVIGRDKVEEGRVAWTSARNLPTDDPQLAAKIMRATASQNVRVSQPVYHMALSFDPKDVVDRAAMERVADDVLKELKLDRHQALIVAHADRAHPHLHILVNRVHPETGLVWDRWQDYPAIQRVLRRHEQELGLRPVEASLDISRGRGAGERLSAIRADFDAHDQVSEMAERRYTAERDLAAGEARMAQLDAALRREEQATAAFDERLRRAFHNPAATREAFLGAAEEAGEREATRRMREAPESFGELKKLTARPGVFGRAHSDGPAREAAREAASYGLEALAAKREVGRLIGMQVETGRITPLVELDRPCARVYVSEQIEAAKNRLQFIQDAEKGMPTRQQIEHRLKQGLRRLSPPEFEQLRVSLSVHRLTLTHKLRQMTRDAALGRDEMS